MGLRDLLAGGEPVTENAGPAAASLGGELPAKADIGDKGLLNTSAPASTSYSRKTIAIAITAFVLAIMVGMTMALPDKKNKDEENREKERKMLSAATAPGGAPEGLKKLPADYANPKNTDNKDAKATAAPTQTAKTPTSQVSVPSSPPVPVRSYPINNSANNAALAELENARRSRIQLFMGNVDTQTPTPSAPAQQGLSMQDIVAAVQKLMGGQGGQQQNEDQNMQQEKRSFSSSDQRSKFYLQSSLQSPISPYEVKAGTMIPAVLITGINSDLPGKIVGQVSQNVYDTVTGQYLLIPQGTKIIGTYDSKVSYAQERVLMVWTRLILPNGDSLDLEGMDGTDASGFSGLMDKVNNHEGKVTTGVLISSILSAGAKIATGNETSGSRSWDQLTTSGIAEQISQFGSRITDKNLSIQPTLEISPGFAFNVFVNKDMILRPYTD